MTDAEILQHVDHTLLKAYASWSEIKAICDEALTYKTASICIPPTYVEAVKKEYGDKINICVVVGFPLGYSHVNAKAEEIKTAKAQGASEFDMVVNICDVKNGAFDKITDEIAALKKVAGDKILKVIIEACYLTEEEKIALCNCVTSAGADFIKTSTGFGTDGATHSDILLFKKHIGPKVKIKAAGWIKTRQDMVDFLEEGCERLGTSSAIKILSGEQSKGY